MTNQYSFDSSIVENYNFDSTIKKNHNFNSCIVKNENYNIVIDNVLQTDSWFIQFLQINGLSIDFPSINISSEIIFESNSEVSIIQDDISINELLEIHFAQENIVRFTPYLELDMGSITFNSYNTMEALVLNFMGGNTIVISIPQVSIDFDVTQHKYYMLSDWDSSLLSDLDSKNLIEMDYEVL